MRAQRRIRKKPVLSAYHKRPDRILNGIRIRCQKLMQQILLYPLPLPQRIADRFAKAQTRRTSLLLRHKPAFHRRKPLALLLLPLRKKLLFTKPLPTEVGRFCASRLKPTGSDVTPFMRCTSLDTDTVGGMPTNICT